MRSISSLIPGALCAVLLLLASAGAGAFTLSDGTSITCVARGVPVIEHDAAAGDPLMRDRTGLAMPQGNGYVIEWNSVKLKSLPAVVHDFIFFHECAHARVPTSEELRANCEGLKDMRAAGRAGEVVEGKLAEFFGAGNAYWAATVKCADRPPAPANLPGAMPLKPPG